jgi:hypothetical protein
MRDALALLFIEFKFHGYNVVSARDARASAPSSRDSISISH